MKRGRRAPNAPSPGESAVATEISPNTSFEMRRRQQNSRQTVEERGQQLQAWPLEPQALDRRLKHMLFQVLTGWNLEHRFQA